MHLLGRFAANGMCGQALLHVPRGVLRMLAQDAHQRPRHVITFLQQFTAADHLCHANHKDVCYNMCKQKNQYRNAQLNTSSQQHQSTCIQQSSSQGLVIVSKQHSSGVIWNWHLVAWCCMQQYLQAHNVIKAGGGFYCKSYEICVTSQCLLALVYDTLTIHTLNFNVQARPLPQL